MDQLFLHISLWFNSFCNQAEMTTFKALGITSVKSHVVDTTFDLPEL